MSDTLLLDQLPADAGVLIAAALFGALGGLAQGAVAQDPSDTSAWWKRVVVGVVTAIGTLWVAKPESALALVGQALLAGYFGRAVLAILQTRVTAALESDKKDRAVAIAHDAIALAAQIPRNAAHALATPDSSQEIAALRGRLADLSAR